MSAEHNPASVNQPTPHEAILARLPNLFQQTNPLMGEALRAELASHALDGLVLAGFVVIRDASGLLHNGDELTKTTYGELHDGPWEGRFVPVWRRVETP